MGLFDLKEKQWIIADSPQEYPIAVSTFWSRNVEKKSARSGYRSDFLSLRRRSSWTLGHRGTSYRLSKMKIFNHQTDEKEGPKVGPTLVPRFGPTFWSHFLRRSRKNRKGMKTRNKSAGRIRSDVLSVRRQALYALGRDGSILNEGEITLLKHQNDDWSHLSVPLFGPTFFILHFP